MKSAEISCLLRSLSGGIFGGNDSWSDHYADKGQGNQKIVHYYFSSRGVLMAAYEAIIGEAGRNLNSTIVSSSRYGLATKVVCGEFYIQEIYRRVPRGLFVAYVEVANRRSFDFASRKRCGSRHSG